MKAIEDAITKLETERARIDGQIEGLKQALKLSSGSNVAQEFTVHKRTRRGNLKETVLDLMGEAAECGLTTAECVQKAKEKDIVLVPSSVSSFLSRLKSDGFLFFDGSRYRLKQYAGPKQAAAGFSVPLGWKGEA
jgi:hypothetical protein